MYALFAKLENWVHSQPPIVSSFSHACIATGLVLFGFLLNWVSSLVDPVPMQFDVFFYGFALGAYALRELEDGRRYIAKGDSKGLLDSVLDFFVPLAIATGVFVLLGGSLA